MAADGVGALRRPDTGELLATECLAVVLTPIALELWYRAVNVLGPGTAGLFAGHHRKRYWYAVGPRLRTPSLVQDFVRKDVETAGPAPTIS